MNTQFADEIQVVKETAASSIPFEGALARVGALDSQQIGKQLDEQGSALLQSVFVGSADKGRFAAAARGNYAEAAAVVLTTPGHAGKIYELGGDAAYALAELASEDGRC